MKTVCRQDGTHVELSDEDAAKWIKIGLATEPTATPPVDDAPVKSDTKPKKADQV
jgi:hypothetical protein